jgi:hypothetical protein
LKKVLVVYYSQSGQLLDIAKNITNDLQKDEEVSLSFYEIKMETDFPFPWNRKQFYNAFPETFLQTPAPLKDLDNPLLKQSYDLVILAYQVWYLSPAIPINSFLKNEVAKPLLKGTPVITVIGCRNMWLMAQEKVKKLLIQCDARLVGNIALVDRHINHISVITIIDWMFAGRKRRFLGIFPKPGVSEKDIRESTKFGAPVLKALKKGDFEGLQEKLVAQGAAVIKPFLIVMDSRANLIFSKWSALIAKKGPPNSKERQPWVKGFNVYLVFAIWVIAPIVFLLFLLVYIPALGLIKKNIEYYQSVNLKSR